MDTPPLPSFAPGSKDLKRLCLHTITTKPWDIHTAIEKYRAAGIGGISVWRDAIAGRDLESIRREMAGTVSLRRAGPPSTKTGGPSTSAPASARPSSYSSAAQPRR